jgi:hypothetical protein
MCLTAVAAFFLGAPFWTLPTLTLNASATAVMIDLINMCANLAGCLANPTTGWLRSPGLGDGDCLLFLATCYMLGGVVMSFVKIPGGTEVPLAPPQSQAS